MAALISSSSDSEETEVNDPTLVAINAGASLSVPRSASIFRKRKIRANERKYKGKGSGENKGKGKGKCNRSAWDRLKDYQSQHFVMVIGNLRCNTCSETLSC